MQQKIMWAEIRKKTGRGKNRFAIRELFVDERCTRVILDFLRMTRWGQGWGRWSCHRNQWGRGRGEIHGLLSHALLSFSFVHGPLSHTLFSLPFSLLSLLCQS